MSFHVYDVGEKMDAMSLGVFFAVTVFYFVLSNRAAGERADMHDLVWWRSVDNKLRRFNKHITLRRVIVVVIVLRVLWHLGLILLLQIAILGTIIWHCRSIVQSRRQRLAATVRRQLANEKTAQRFLSHVGTPPWVSFTAVEPSVWVRSFISNLWPHIAAATEDTITRTLNNLLSQVSAPVIGSLSVTKCTFGTQPIVIRGVEESRTDRAINIDLHLSWHSDLNIRVSSSLLHVPFAVENLTIEPCVVRMQLLDLCSQWPCFRVIAIAFRNKPTIGMKVTALVSINQIPGATSLVSDLLESSVFAALTYPRRFVYRVFDSASQTIGGDVDPLGWLDLRILDARRKNSSFFQSSIYIAALLNSKRMALADKDQYRELFYDSSAVLELVVYSRSVDEPLGKKKIKLGLLLESSTNGQPQEEVIASCTGTQDEFIVKYCATATAFEKAENEESNELSGMDSPAAAAPSVSEVKPSPSISRSPKPAEPEAARTMLQTVIVTIHHCRDLLNVETFGKSDPFVEVAIKDVKARTKTIANSLEPVYNEALALRVTEVSAIELVVYDDERISSPRKIGHCTIEASDVVIMSNDRKQRTLKLSPQGVVTLSLKAFQRRTP